MQQSDPNPISPYYQYYQQLDPNPDPSRPIVSASAPPYYPPYPDHNTIQLPPNYQTAITSQLNQNPIFPGRNYDFATNPIPGSSSKPDHNTIPIPLNYQTAIVPESNQGSVFSGGNYDYATKPIPGSSSEPDHNTIRPPLNYQTAIVSEPNQDSIFSGGNYDYATKPIPGSSSGFSGYGYADQKFSQGPGNYGYATSPEFDSGYSEYDRNNQVGNYGYATETKPGSSSKFSGHGFADQKFSEGPRNYGYATSPEFNSGYSEYDGSNQVVGKYGYATKTEPDPGLGSSFPDYGYAGLSGNGAAAKPGLDSAFSDFGLYDRSNGVAGSYNYSHGSKPVKDYDLGSYGDGIYAYSGGNKDPYGARGTGKGSSGSVVFDDYGRPISGVNGGKSNGPGSRIVKATIKDDLTENDVAGGVQKFRVRLLSEGVGQSEIDVLCQIGLDGIRIVDPATGRTLKIYPLEAVTRWEVLDSYIFAFWAKTAIDMEPKRIRLKSNSYTSNNMLDMVTAVSFQLKEIGDTKKPSDGAKVSELASERKKGFPDWMNLMKPRNEEKDYWVPDEAVTKCTACGTDFNAFNRRHHCRNCGDIFCDKCTQGRIELTTDENDVPVRVCDHCMAEVSQRLADVKESSGEVAKLQSHADLAKKLKEEMDKNRKTSSGLISAGSGMRTKDVACPTCTVHLQVQVPSSGSETIECSVCQHPFLVHA